MSDSILARNLLIGASRLCATHAVDSSMVIQISQMKEDSLASPQMD